MGAPDKWNGVGIFVDAFDDDHRGNNPAIYGILNHGEMEYRAHQDGEGQYFAGCLRNIRNLEHPFGIRATFMRQSLKLEVSDNMDSEQWVTCFEKQGVALPAGYYFGISASTNDHPDGMELLDWMVQGAEPVDRARIEREMAAKNQPAASGNKVNDHY